MAVVLYSLACFNFYIIKAYLLSFLILYFLNTFILSVGNLLWVLHCHDYISIAYFTAKLYRVINVQFFHCFYFWCILITFSICIFNSLLTLSFLHIFKDSTTICDSIFFSQKVCFWRYFPPCLSDALLSTSATSSLLFTPLLAWSSLSWILPLRCLVYSPHLPGYLTKELPRKGLWEVIFLSHPFWVWK